MIDDQPTRMIPELGDDSPITSESQGHDPWIGRTLGDFMVEESIGHGGMGTVYRARQISLGRSVALPKEAADGFTPYWLQAVYCSTAVEVLARMMPVSKRPRPGMLYLAGLLHNFGYLILAHSFPPHFTSICRYMEANPAISHVALENHLIGISREQISAWLMQAWNMPEEVCIALRYQQDGSYQGPYAVYANLIFVAMRLLRQHGIGDAPPEPVSAALYQQLGLDLTRCEDAIQKLVNSSDVRSIADQMAH